MSVFIKQSSTIQTGFKADSGWVILSSIEAQIKAKIEAIGVPLKDWDINIYRGILTGYNEAFIIDENTKNELIKQSGSTDLSGIIRPILRGRDIKKYTTNFADKWLIYIPWHFPIHKDSSISGASIEAEREFAKSYGVIYEYLCTHKSILEKRNQAETGIRYEWYALQRCAATYFDDFNKDKIVYIDIMTDNEEEGYEFPSFSYSEKGELLLNTAYFITGETLIVKYLLSILNSRIGKFLIKNYTSQLQQRQYRMFSQYIVAFPIPQVDATTMEKFKVLINEIMALKNKLLPTQHLENTINSLAYELYGFSNHEKEYFENLK